MSMPKRRLPQTDVKWPDQFLMYFARPYEYVRTHTAFVSILLAAAFAVGGLVWGYSAFLSARDQRAAAEMAVLLSIEPQSSLFQEFLVEHGSTSSAPLAWLYLAHEQYSEGDYHGALGSYERATSSRRPSDYLEDQALLGRAYSLVGLTRCEEAEALFRQFIALSGPLPKDDALLAIGRCHEGAQDWETALLRYEEFLESYPESPFGTEQLRRTVEGLRQRVLLGK